MFKIRLIFDMSNIPVNQINTSKMQDFDKKRTRWEQSLVGSFFRIHQLFTSSTA